MNDQVLIELRVVVERAVRPVRASDVRKLRMREELLDHLTAIYEEELGRLGDESVAVAKALERFGAPSELTGELQQSVSRLDFIGYVSDLYRYRRGESLLRFGFRHLVAALGAMVIMVLMMLSLAWMGGRIDEIGFLLRIAAVTVFVVGAGIGFSFTFIGEQMGQILYGQGFHHPARAMISYISLSLLVFPLMAAFTHGLLMLSGDAALKGFLLGCAAAPAAPVFFYMQARQMKKQISAERDWMGLEIDQ